MSLSVQRPVVEPFEFNGKNIRSLHVKGEECLTSRNVYKAIRYEVESGKKVIQNLVPNKYKQRSGDAVIDMKGVDIRLHRDTVILTENGLKLFLMRCRKPKALDVAKHFGIKIELCLLASKKQDALSQIMQSSRDEEMIHQFVLENTELTYIFQGINWPLNAMSLTIMIETLDTK